jgi:hypothetical protein
MIDKVIFIFGCLYQLFHVLAEVSFAIKEIAEKLKQYSDDKK